MKSSALLLLHAAALVFGWWLGHGGNTSRDANNATKLTTANQTPTKSLVSSATTKDAAKTKANPPALEKIQRYLLDGNECFSISDFLVPKLSHAEFAPALALMLKSPFLQGRQRMVRQLFQRWAEIDRAEALQHALALVSPQLKEEAVKAVLDAWLKSDPGGAWQWVLQLGDDPVLMASAIEKLVTAGAKSDPAGYARWIEEISDPVQRAALLWKAAAAWLPQDSKAALAWMRSIEPASVRQRMMEDLRRDSDAFRGEQAWETLLQWPDKSTREEEIAIQLVLYNGKEEEAKSVQWFIAHAGNVELQKAGAMLGGALTNNWSAAQLEQMTRNLPAGPVRDAFVGGAARAYVESHKFSDAIALLKLGGPCAERSMALSELGEVIGQLDATTSEPLVRAMRPGYDQDYLLEGYASRLSEKNPRLATLWAAQITDAAARLMAVQDAYDVWQGADLPAAEAWLRAASQFSEAEKNTISNP